MRHFLSTEDWSRDDLQQMIDRARAFRDSPQGEALKGKSVALMFFNPSLRTRSSFDIGVHHLGGHAVMLDAQGQTWPLEFEEGAVMDGGPEEHVKEAARVLSRYVDLIAIRCFPKFQDWKAEREDPLITAYAKYATVPVINMETIVHPCQELAMMMALQDRIGDVRGKDFLLTWVPHPKPLNTAVANSALMIAAKFGMKPTLLCPTKDYILDERYMEQAEKDAGANGVEVTVTHDIDEAYADADVVYAKSWGALPFFGDWEPEKPIRDAHKHFIVDEEKMRKTNNALVSHCLPMRRNVKMTDAVFDGPTCIAYEEAENRLHVQKAIMKALAG